MTASAGLNNDRQRKSSQGNKKVSLTENCPDGRELSFEKNGFKNMTYETGLSVEKMLTSLFQPDTLLPAQYLETFRRKAHLEPEKRLMLAVLEDAVGCFQKYIFARDGKGKASFREAKEWIVEEDSDWLFSFENICEVLGFNPQYVRQGLMRWKEKKLAERPKAKIYRLIPRAKKKHPIALVFKKTGESLSKVVAR